MDGRGESRENVYSGQRSFCKNLQKLQPIDHFGRLRGSIIRALAALQVPPCDTGHTATSGKHGREKQTDAQAKNLQRRRDIRPSLSVFLANCSPSNRSPEQNKHTFFMLFFLPFSFRITNRSKRCRRPRQTFTSLGKKIPGSWKRGKHGASEFLMPSGEKTLH